MCPHSYFHILISSEKNATAQTLWVDGPPLPPPRAVCCCWATEWKYTITGDLWLKSKFVPLSHCHLCTHTDTRSLFLRHQPVSQRVPMNPGGHMQSPSASWHTPPFRHSGQSLLQPGPHFLLAQPTGKKSFPNSKTAGIKLPMNNNRVTFVPLWRSKHNLLKPLQTTE